MAPPPSRSPWQRIYGALVARRARRLQAAAARLPRPVVSIGNLCWGGGGKTPFTIAVAARERDAGRSVAILSRGYRRRSRGPLLVSRGNGPLVSVAEAGDEPHAMAAELAGVTVAVAARREAAGRLALSALDGAIDLFLLDDGFSHAALARDLDLLLFPADDPWAGGRLAPSGRLREPLSAARRADAVVLTGAPAGADGAELAQALAPHGFEGPGFASSTEPQPPQLADGEPLAPGTPVMALAAIARPAGFFAAAESAGLAVVARQGFRDHWDYSELDLRAIERTARDAGATALVTTSKDVAKLAGRTSLPLAVLPVEARPEPEFWIWFDEQLGAARR